MTEFRGARDRFLFSTLSINGLETLYQDDANTLNFYLYSSSTGVMYRLSSRAAYQYYASSPIRIYNPWQYNSTPLSGLPSSTFILNTSVLNGPDTLG